MNPTDTPTTRTGKVIIVAPPCSGTRFLTKFLKAHSLDMGHETIHTGGGVGYNLLVEYQGWRSESHTILQMTRHPLHTLSSFHGMGISHIQDRLVRPLVNRTGWKLREWTEDDPKSKLAFAMDFLLKCQRSYAREALAMFKVENVQPFDHTVVYLLNRTFGCELRPEIAERIETNNGSRRAESSYRELT